MHIHNREVTYMLTWEYKRGDNPAKIVTITGPGYPFLKLLIPGIILLPVDTRFSGIPGCFKRGAKTEIKKETGSGVSLVPEAGIKQFFLGYFSLDVSKFFLDRCK